MKVFLSWSGQRSKSVAHALRDWLPLVLYYVRPWLSQQDIAAGDRWSVEVGKELDESQFGILCLTPENLTAPWILFEAGAISKSFSTGAVCPYLYGVDYSSIVGPLSQFQGKKTDYQSTKELLEAINSKSTTPLDTNRLNKLYDKLWPELEEQLDNIPDPSLEAQTIRSQSEVLEDLVQSIRVMEGRFREFGETLASQDAVIRPIIRYFNDASRVAVVVEAVDDVGNLKRGSVVTLQVQAVKLIQALASKLGINPEDYHTTWFLSDRQTNESLSKHDIIMLSDKYRGEVCFLKLIDPNEIPF